MDPLRHRSLTLDAQPDVFPGTVALLDSHSGQLWWNLLYTFDMLRKRGCSLDQKAWLRFGATVLQKASVDPSQYHIYAKGVPRHFWRHVASTCSLLVLFAMLVEATRTEFADVYLEHLGKICCKCVSELRREVTWTVGGGISIIVTPCGQAVGFLAVLAQTFHPHVLPAFQRMWDYMLDNAILQGPWLAATHYIKDVCLFLTCFLKVKRSLHSTPLSSINQRKLAALKVSLMKFLADRLECYITYDYIARHDANKARPSRGRKPATASSQRPYVSLDPATIWDLIEEARSDGVSLQQLLQVRRRDDHVGCHACMAYPWLAKLQNMYSDNQSRCFTNVNHFNLVADGAVHSKSDTFVSLFWCHEINMGAYGTIQRAHGGRFIFPDELEMDDEVQRLVAQRKHERAAAFRQLQATSHVLWLSTGKKVELLDFIVPPGVHIRPLQHDEQYVIESTDSIDIAYKITKDRTRCQKVLEDDELEDVKLLVLALDQGGPGCAGAAFAMFHLMMMFAVAFDKIHRLVRDLKLSVQRAAGGIFLKAQLYLNHVWSLNYKPWGTGVFSTAKRRMLDAFLKCCSYTDEIFYFKYGPKMAACWQMDFDTEAAKQRVFDEMPLRLLSFRRSLETPKLSRWCSWNKAAHEQLPEFFAAKMVYEWNAAGRVSDPDSDVVAFDQLQQAAKASDTKKQVELIKKTAGGFELAYKLMHTVCYILGVMLSIVHKAMWDWYTDQVENCKSPTAHLLYLHHMRTQWSHDTHMKDMLKAAFVNPQNLDRMEIGANDKSEATINRCASLVSLVLHTLGQRGWSLSRHTVPPECYVDILSNSASLQKDGCSLLKSDHAMMVELESNRHSVSICATLWEHIHPFQQMPVRLMYAFFQRDKYSPRSVAGRKLLKGQLSLIADNKSVEDLNKVLREDSNSNVNRMMTNVHMQDKIMSSGVIEGRDVQHGPKVGKAQYIRNFRSTAGRSSSKKHYAHKHRMTRCWGEILKTKHWPTLAEETIRRSAAAFAWLRKWCSSLRQLSLEAALCSRLVGVGIIIRSTADGNIFVTCGNYSWAALALPVCHLWTDGNGYAIMQIAVEGALELLHVTNPHDWYVLPFENFRLAQGVVQAQSQEPVSLIRWSLEHMIHSLTEDDLRRVWQTFDPPPPPEHVHFDKKALIEGLAATVVAGGERDEFLKACLQAYESIPPRSACHVLASDAWVEACYDDLDEKDKGEYGDLGDAIKKTRVKRKYACFQEHARSFARGVRRRAHAKARADGRAAPRSVPAPQSGPAASSGAPGARPAASSSRLDVAAGSGGSGARPIASRGDPVVAAAAGREEPKVVVNGEWIEFAVPGGHGTLRYSCVKERLDAHCAYHGGSCKLDRTLKKSPVGLCVAWLQQGRGVTPKAHREAKAKLSSSAGYVTRRIGRKQFEQYRERWGGIWVEVLDCEERVSGNSAEPATIPM